VPVANESFANTLIVEIAGAPLADDVKTLLAYCYVDDSRNLPDAFVLRFRDPGHIVLSKAHITVGAAVKLKVQTADPGGPQPLMSGEVTAIGFDLDPTGTFTEVRGYDKAHRLFHGRRVAAYPNMTVADIVRKVTQRAGLEPGDIDNVPGFGGQLNTQISQDNVSDWDFLSRIAAAVGAQVAVLDGKLSFKLPAPPASAPAESAKATANPLVLEAHRTLVSLRASITSAEQVPQVEVRGWDFTNKAAVTATAKPTIAGTEIQGTDPVAFANTFGSPNFVAADVPYRAQAEVQAGADALAAQLGGACAELEGVAKGNPKLRAGTPVTLTNVGDAFAGKYTLTGTRHLFNDQVGYTTAFTVSGRQERSLYGLATGGSGGSSGARRIDGLVVALVSDVKDPSQLGRVRLTFPWLDKDFTSNWARVVQTGGGSSRGLYVLPEVNDEVIVGFELGDFDSPYVIGGLWNGTDKPPKLSTDVVDASTGEIKARAFVSRKGHKLEFVEDSGITLTSGDGSVLITLDATNQNIQITSGKTVTVKAANGISFDAGSGTLEFKGQKLSLTSTTDYELHATGQLKLSGDGGVTVGGPSVSIAGQAETKVTSGGQLTLQGAIVNIN
jgi:uncharacterized protein involved in type VI secretion and phage assembly